jgi:hypothetical protein
MRVILDTKHKSVTWHRRQNPYGSDIHAFIHLRIV